MLLSGTREHHALARNDTSDAAGRWLYSIIAPREVWSAHNSSRQNRREVPHQQARCRRSADAAVSRARTEEPMLTVSHDRALLTTITGSLPRPHWFVAN